MIEMSSYLRVRYLKKYAKVHRFMFGQDWEWHIVVLRDFCFLKMIYYGEHLMK